MKGQKMYFNPEKLNQLNNALAKIKKIELGVFPTPLHELKNMSKMFNGPRILFKREDLSGLAFGGNKTRMFEYSLARAINNHCDCVITTSVVQSNYCRQLAASCAKLGLKLYLILRPIRGKDDLIKQGNVLLDYLLGAEVEVLKEDSLEKQQKIAEELENELIKKGRRPYRARSYSEADKGLESCAFSECFTEIIQQTEKLKIDFNYIFVSSQDSTQGGLLFAAKFIEADLTIIGINPIIEDNAAANICEVQKEISRELKLKVHFDWKSKIINLTDYAGGGYCVPSKEGIEAIKLVAQTEGILLDPVYSGKAMAGLIDYIKKGKLSKSDSVIFIHTGGNPALFAFSKELGF